MDGDRMATIMINPYNMGMETHYRTPLATRLEGVNIASFGVHRFQRDGTAAIEVTPLSEDVYKRTEGCPVHFPIPGTQRSRDTL